MVGRALDLAVVAVYANWGEPDETEEEREALAAALHVAELDQMAQNAGAGRCNSNCRR